jgi:hypothetical protein
LRRFSMSSPGLGPRHAIHVVVEIVAEPSAARRNAAKFSCNARKTRRRSLPFARRLS